MSDLMQLAPVLSALGLQNAPKMVLLDAGLLNGLHIPPFPADTPALLLDIPVAALENVQAVLQTVYADEHPLRIVDSDITVIDLTLSLLSVSEYSRPLSAIYIPPLDEGTSLIAFQEIVAHLRAPDGCPWDKKQTHQTLRQHLLEESYEALAAMDDDDAPAMAEEFGDLLLQIVLNAQIANENKAFALSDVIKGIYDKIVRRHPHVFGDVNVDGVGEVLKNWEQLKEDERKTNGETEKGLLDGVPLLFPSLNQAQEYQERAARVGFDWPEIDGVLDKLAEEVDEIRQAANEEELASEIGDLFFVLVNFARWQNVDAESALREANMRFKHRFGFIEQMARKQKRPLSGLTLDEMEYLWQEAKRTGL